MDNPYHIVSSDFKKIVLKKSGYGCANVIPVLIGLPLVIGGLYMFPLTLDQEIHFTFLAFFITIFGLLFFTVGAFLAPENYRRVPNYITFNHEKAWIEISMTKNGITGYMPYKSIDSFDFYQNLGKHIIYMKKKDGAVWPLIQVSSQKKAEEVLELFREKILESKEVNTSYQFSLPEKFTTTLTNDKVLVYWKGKFSSAIIIVGLFIVLFSAVTTMAVFDLGKIWVMAIPFIMASAGLFFLVYKLYQQYSRKYAIAIDREHLMYYEFSGKTGKNKNMRSVPLTSIHTIVYISNLFSIKIITPDDIAYNELTANDPEKRMIDRIYNRNQPLLINLTAVNPAEGVSLEYWLQQQIGLMKPDLEIK